VSAIQGAAQKKTFVRPVAVRVQAKKAKSELSHDDKKRLTNEAFRQDILFCIHDSDNHYRNMTEKDCR
jgi:hypothetical protein